MSIFLYLMIVGLIGLVLMAVPGLNRHGHAGTAHGLGHGGHGLTHGIGHGHAAGHLGPTGHVAPAAHAAGGQAAQGTHGHGGPGSQEPSAGAGLTRLIPSPRTIFSLLTLYGAFGYALLKSAHLMPMLAGLLALIPAILIERYAVTPFWNLLLQFQGRPDGPLEELVYHEAEAVTPFRNGKGVVSVVRDGRAVQFTARLPEGQAIMPVHVGDKLRIEDVDSENQRVTVSLQ
jgi:hypothetical protein